MRDRCSRFLPEARLAAILLATLAVCVPAHATLAVLVPSRDGLIVAADSRMTYLGASCDGTFKILIPARPARTAVIVTGDSIFVPPPTGNPDPCGYLASAPRLLDVGAVVTAYLDRNAIASASIPLAGLAAACVRAAQRFQQSYPDALRSYAGREIFSVIVAGYDPTLRTSSLRNFVVRMDARTHRIQAARFSRTTVFPRDHGSVWIYGETGYVDKYVYNGFGRRFLSAATLGLISARAPISQLPADKAIAAAADVIRAASRAAETVPAPTGIGGPIRVIVLDRSPRAEQVPAPAP